MNNMFTRLMMKESPSAKPSPYAKAANVPAITVSQGPITGIKIETIAITREAIPKLFCMIHLQNPRYKNKLPV
jgi:hypothetical protein